jgi:hypothetical protein
MPTADPDPDRRRKLSVLDAAIAAVLDDIENFLDPLLPRLRARTITATEFFDEFVHATMARVRAAIADDAAARQQWWTLDIWTLLAPRSTRKQRHAAAERFAARMPTTFRNPQVRRVLARMEGEPAARYVHRTHVAALLLASARRKSPSRIRLGRQWVKRNGRVATLAPADLPYHRRGGWLYQEARSIAERMILDLDLPPALARLSARERELVTLLQKGLSRPRVAAEMRIDDDTLRVMLHRAGKKMGGLTRL